MRPENQDAYFIDLLRQTNQALCVVCDGMGGARAGDVASELAVRVFSEEVLSKLKPSMNRAAIAETMSRAVEATNKEIFEKSMSNEEYFGMGTTLVAAVITDNTAVIANVGDSRAYLITKEGLHKVTHDHSVVEDMIHRGEITRDQARRHPVKNYITRAIGTEDHVDCDIFTVSMNEGDFLLLCSDGLSNIVSDPEMLFEVIYWGAPDDCCERLLAIATGRGAPDNVTIVIFQR